QWVIVSPLQFLSAQGAVLTSSTEGIIRSEGARPDRDTYTVTTRTKLKGITGIRLELLPDDKLPHHGPGRQDNGNLHLSEFQILSAKLNDNVPGKSQNVKLRSAVADYDQPGWTVSHAIDGDTKTAWGIYPQVGKAHEAVFTLENPLGSGEELELTFRLEQL